MALLTATILLLTGCFSYVPFDLGAASVGREVRIQLRPTAVTELSNPGAFSYSETGPMLEGTVTSVNADQLLITLPIFGRQAGLFPNAPEAQVPVSVSQISIIQRRQLDRPKTLMAVGGVLAAVTVMILAGAFNLQTDPAVVPLLPPVEAEELRIPLLSGSR
jgi:hypothetical protein